MNKKETKRTKMDKARLDYTRLAWFVLDMCLAECKDLYCAPKNLCWPCRARKLVEDSK